MKPLILLIEDDPQIRRFLRAALDAEGYRLQESITAEEGLAQASSRQPDLILLDLGLPDRDGLEVIQRVREWGKIPIVVLSARGQEKDKIAALDLGADDYVAKPFAVGELLARIRAALRRATARVDGAGSLVHFGPVEVDLETRRARRRPGSPSDAQRVQAAAGPDPARRESADAAAIAERSVGPSAYRTGSISPRLHRPVAPQIGA